MILISAVLAGCGVAPIDTRLISSTPADVQSFSVAQRAARSCIDIANTETLRRNFERAGFGVSAEQRAATNGRTIEHTVISSPDNAVSALILGNSCYVGLENMTPVQSAQLAQIWVEAYAAKPNAAFGDGLSDHVSGAWRNFFTEPHRIPDKAAYSHKIYIAAYQTWPHGPYDPQRQVGYAIPEFPETPGAAVSLRHVIECQPQVQTGAKSGVFLPCSGPEYKPG